MRRTHPHRTAALATTVTATLLLAGCGDAQPTAEPAAQPAAQTTAPADDAPVATDTVAIQNFAYSPATITVKAGTTVTWTNSDTDPHTVTSMNDGPIKSPTLDRGDTFRHTFARPGRFEYLCTVHPFMTATVVVTP